MRPLHLLFVGVHVLVLTIACRDLLSNDLEPAVVQIAADTLMVTVPEEGAKTAEAIDDEVNQLMGAIQHNARDVDAMTALAHLYMRHGWWEQAVGPLARAVELEPGRDDLRHQLQLALKLGELGDGRVDVDALAREFAELAAMWGHGC